MSDKQKSKPKPLKLRELLKKLRPYGIISMTKSRGKGSETILIKPDKDNPKKGPQYPVKNHGPGTETHIPVIKAILRRFGIKNFWD